MTSYGYAYLGVTEQTQKTWLSSTSCKFAKQNGCSKQQLGCWATENEGRFDQMKSDLSVTKNVNTLLSERF